MPLKRSLGIIFALVLLFSGLHLAILAGSMDENHHDEELFRGNIAKEYLGRPQLPFFDYQRSEYEGGCLVAGALAVPFYAVFGDNLLSLKLSGLVFPALALVIWFFFLQRFYGRKTALLFGLLWVFAAPFFTKWGLLTYGEYGEFNLFTICAIFIFCELFLVKERLWLYALFGLVSGFAVFFHYYFLILLAVFLFFWFIFDHRFILRSGFWIFSAGFVAGFTPWIYYNLNHNFEGFTVADKPVFAWFCPASAWQPLVRLKDLLFFQVPDAFGFTDLGWLDHRLAAYLYYFVFLLAFSWLVYYNRVFLRRMLTGKGINSRDMKPEIILMAFFLGFCAVFSFSSFRFWADFYECYVNRYRYLIPVFPAIFACIAIFYQRSRGSMRRAAGVSVVLVLLLGVVYSIGLIKPENWGKNYIADSKGYNYYDLGKIICWRSFDPAASLRSAAAIKNPEDRFLCYAGMGFGFAKQRFNADYRYYLRSILPSLDKKYWPHALERVGTVLGFSPDLVAETGKLEPTYRNYLFRGFGIHLAANRIFQPDVYLQLLSKIDPQYREDFHRGIGTGLDALLFSDPAAFIRFVKTVPQEFVPAVYLGIAEGKVYYQYNYSIFGSGIGKIGFDADSWKRIAAGIPREYLPRCYRRLGIEIGWRLIHNLKEYNAFIAATDPEYLPELVYGVGVGIGWRFGYAPGLCRRIVKELNSGFLEQAQKGIEEGARKMRGEEKIE